MKQVTIEDGVAKLIMDKDIENMVRNYYCLRNCDKVKVREIEKDDPGSRFEVKDSITCNGNTFVRTTMIDIKEVK